MGEVALRLGIRLVRWRRRRFARLLTAFGLALLFFFGLDTTLFLRRQPGVDLQRRHRLLDLRQSFLLVAGPIRHLVAALVLAESLVLFGIRRLGGRQHASDLGFQFRLAFLHALITHRFMFRRVRFDLRAVKRDNHPRVKRRLPKTTHIAARDLLEIKALPHQLNDKPRDMAFRHEVLHIRRQQQCLIDIPGAKILAHSSSLNQTRSKLNSDYSDRLLGGVNWITRKPSPAAKSAPTLQPRPPSNRLAPSTPYPALTTTSTS